MNFKKKEARRRKEISLKQKQALVQYQVQKIDYYDFQSDCEAKVNGCEVIKETVNDLDPTILPLS